MSFVKSTYPWGFLVLLLAVQCNPTLSFQTSRCKQSGISLAAAATSEDEAANNAASKLLDKAALLRAEIAQMEGKTLEEVQAEAQEKKMAMKRMEEETKARRESDRAQKTVAVVDVPTTIDEMLQQAGRAIEHAYQDGITRQTVRLALLREGEQMFDVSNEWPGGVTQMYRQAGKPLTSALLRLIRTNSDNGLPPTIREQEIWDFDGSALHTAEAEQASGDIQALVFPNTDVKYINDIATIDQAMGPDRLFLLMNPFWRNLDSWGFNLLAPGAKQKAQETIFKRGYDETYVLMRFSARGENCVAIKAYPNDWQLFAYKEDDSYGFPTEVAIRLGSSETEPTTTIMTELLNQHPEFKDATRNLRQLQKFF